MITCSFENGNTATLRHVVADSLVLQGDRILLVKRSNKLSEGGKWALPGGFVDRNETIKEAAVREIMEETGYEVADMTLLRIIDAPNRPAEDRQNIAFVHFCVARERTGVPDWESSDVRWFSLSALPEEREFAFDHYSNIRLYREFLAGRLELPAVR
jgi:8-oxo-dGTP diphosphatase